MRNIYKKLKPFMKELIKLIRVFYKDNLRSLVIFGSYARGEVTLGSDIDILIILKECKLSYRERLQEFYEDIESKITTGPSLLVSPIILKEEEAREFNPIYLEIMENNIIVFDDGTFKNILDKLKRLQEERVIEKKTLKGKTYWRVRDEKAYRGLY